MELHKIKIFVSVGSGRIILKQLLVLYFYCHPV